MKVYQEIVNSIMEYPSLYKDINYQYSKEKVLNQLFFTNGNGYKWVNGELISDTEERYQDFPKDYFNIPIMTTIKEELDFEKEMRLKFHKNKEFKSSEICCQGASTIYPICEYAKIMNLPNNIKKDWLKAATEAVKIAIDYYNDPYKHCADYYIKDYMDDREYTKIAKYLQSQRQYLLKAEWKINVLRNI